jgi:hypothetical protein
MLLSLYRVFGGIGLILLGVSMLPYPLPAPVRWITGACLVIAGAALIIGL